MKCSVDPKDLENFKGKDATLDINNHKSLARMAEGIFGVADGQFCFSKGSSGWTLPSGMKVEFSEVVMRGGNAAQAFDKPAGGSSVSWKLVP